MDVCEQKPVQVWFAFWADHIQIPWALSILLWVELDYFRHIIPCCWQVWYRCDCPGPKVGSEGSSVGYSYYLLFSAIQLPSITYYGYFHVESQPYCSPFSHFGSPESILTQKIHIYLWTTTILCKYTSTSWDNAVKVGNGCLGLNRHSGVG